MLVCGRFGSLVVQQLKGENNPFTRTHFARAHAALVWSLASGRWDPVRWRYVNVHEVSDRKLGLGEGFRVVRPLLAGAGDTDLAHSVHRATFRVNDGKVKVRALAPRLWVYVPHQRRQFA